MLTLRRRWLMGLMLHLLASVASAPSATFAQAPRPSTAPAAAAVAPAAATAKPAPVVTPKPATPSAAKPAAPGAPPPASAPEASPPVAAPAPIAAPAPGTITGHMLLARGGPPKQGVVYLDGAVAGNGAPRERLILSQRTFHFQPEMLVVPVGQTVFLPNDDHVMHSPFSISQSKPFDLGHIAPGETRTVTFDHAGVIDIFCNVHENMQAVIVVTPSSFYSLIDAEGNFSISSVPPGHYRVIGFSPQVGQTGQVAHAVEVKSRERTTVQLLLGPAAAKPKEGSRG